MTRSGPRGKAASTETVELFKLVFNAGRPVTFEEIVTGLPAAMRSHAYREYKQHLIEQAVPVKDDGWNDQEKDAAWRWWVGRLVFSGVNTKRLIVETESGRSTRGATQEDKRYTPGIAPMVDRVVSTTERVPWSPEVELPGVQAVAKANFQQGSTELLRADGRHNTKAEVDRVLRLGRQALGLE